MKDCCSEHKVSSKKKSLETDWKNLTLWVIIGILVLGVAYSMVSADSSSVGSTAQAASQAAQSYSGMVGGC